MAALSAISLVVGFSGPWHSRVVVESTTRFHLPHAIARGVSLVVDYLAPVVAHPLVCVVVLWLAVAGGTFLWFVSRALTDWLGRPRCRRVPPATSPTHEELLAKASEIYQLQVKLIEQSALPDDAKKHAKREAEKRYMWEIAEIVKNIHPG